MKLKKHSFFSILSHPLFFALLITGIFYISHGYRYAMDDQLIEIPFLKMAIDPELYPRDDYVQTKHAHYLTFFYKSLGRIVLTEHIKPVYALLFFVSRLLMFFWMYKFWLLITKKRVLSLFCVLGFMVVLRSEMFLYRTFSHAEFALAPMFAGLYYFFKSRYRTASIILGVTMNIHLVFALFPMFYLVTYLLLKLRHKFRVCLESIGLFTLFSLPVVIFYLRSKTGTSAGLGPEEFAEFFKLIRHYAPYFFFFGRLPLSEAFSSFFQGLISLKFIIFLITLYGTSLLISKEFRSQPKFHVMGVIIFLSLVLQFWASYIHPNLTVLCLLLNRQIGILSFILIGIYISGCWKALGERQNLLLGVVMGFAMLTFTNKDFSSIGFLILLLPIWIFTGVVQVNKEGVSSSMPAEALRGWGLKYYIRVWPKLCLCVLFSTGIIIWGLIKMCQLVHANPFQSPLFVLVSWLMLLSAFVYYFVPQGAKVMILRIMLLIPLCVFLSGYTGRHIKDMRRARTPIELIHKDVEVLGKHIRTHTEKDALFLFPEIPYNTFRLHAQRSLVFSEADTGTFALDIASIKDYLVKLEHLGSFKFNAPRASYKQAVMRAIRDYNVDYIVFFRGEAPKPTKTLSLVYISDLFALYKLNRK